jgi:signal transduction histidine kinase
MKLIGIYSSVSAQLLNTSSVKEMYRLVTDAALAIVGQSAIELFASGSRGFRSVYSRGVLERKRGFFIRDERCPLLRKIVSNPLPFFVSNAKRDLDSRDLKFFPQLNKNISGIFVPVNIGGEVRGFMVIALEEVLEYVDEIILTLLSGMANLASLSIEKIISQREQASMKQAFDRFERLTAMGRIIAGVAHEINNPLSIMQFDLDDLRRLCQGTCAMKGEYREILDSLQEEIERMTGIISQLKDFSKPEISEVNARVAVDEVIKSYPLKIVLKNIKKSGITVRTDLNAGSRYARISKNRLLQVLMNLINNADDALSDREGGILEIETKVAEKNGARIAISIRDNGIGIEEENLPRIFEPFYTTKKAEGTGLGLSISYSIIKSCDGEIEVKSTKGLGSEFVVYLPLADDDAK